MNIKLQECINETVHEKAVHMIFEDDLLEITYFPNLNRAYVIHGKETYWFEADGPHHAREQYFKMYFWDSSEIHGLLINI